MPSGSTFSMLHTVMQLSAQSRTTSYSISFQPVRSSSTRTCGDSTNATLQSSFSSFSFTARPLPFPPSANAPRTITGKPIVFPAITPSATDSHAMLRGTSILIDRSSALNIALSSVFHMLSTLVPSTSMPCFCSTPRRSSSTPQFKAVCPPKLSAIASGFSRSIIRSTNAGVTGTK